MLHGEQSAIRNANPIDAGPKATLPNPASTSTTSDPKPEARKRAGQSLAKTELHAPKLKTETFTIRSPTWSYIHLQHLASSSNPESASLDAITAHSHLTAALRQFLGVHGAAIAFDLLKLEGREVWVRVAVEDGRAVIAAAGGWVGGSGGEGWRVRGWSSWSSNCTTATVAAAAAAAAAGVKDGGGDLFVD